ncbi:hypothetical protein Tco_0247115 [Tanacetum coccineum]
MQVEEKSEWIKASTNQWYLYLTVLAEGRASTWQNSQAKVLIFVEDSWNEEPCRDVHQVGDEREVEVLRNFNWPPSDISPSNHSQHTCRLTSARW